jgi:hypothetical protein
MNSINKAFEKFEKKYDIEFLIEELTSCIEKKHYKTEMCSINLSKAIELLKELNKFQSEIQEIVDKSERNPNFMMIINIGKNKPLNLKID